MLSLYFGCVYTVIYYSILSLILLIHSLFLCSPYSQHVTVETSALMHYHGNCLHQIELDQTDSEE